MLLPHLSRCRAPYTVTGVFAQNQSQLTLTLSNVHFSSYYLDACYAYAFSGTVSVSGPWGGGPLHFQGTGFVLTVTGTDNVTNPSSDLSLRSLNHPSSASSDFETPETEQQI